MPDFHTRLARLADAVRALEGGEEVARGLLRLVADMDVYLESTQARRYAQRTDLFQKWSEFLNATAADADRYHKEWMEAERRRIARRIAADPRWQGGYADALALIAREEEQL